MEVETLQMTEMDTQIRIGIKKIRKKETMQPKVGRDK